MLQVADDTIAHMSAEEPFARHGDTEECGCQIPQFQSVATGDAVNSTEKLPEEFQLDPGAIVARCELVKALDQHSAAFLHDGLSAKLRMRR